MAHFAVVPLAQSVLVVEDHEVARLGLCSFLRQKTKVQHIQECETLPSALEALDESAFDLAIFDLDVPGMSDPLNPVELANVRRSFPTMKVVVMSGFTQRGYILAALSAGAHGYIPKRYSMEQVVERLARVMAGEIFVPPSLAELDALPAVASRLDVNVAGAAPTDRQLEVLELMSEGLTNKVIGQRLQLTESTIKLHASGLYQHLGVKNRSQAILAGQKYLKGRRPVQ